MYSIPTVCSLKSRGMNFIPLDLQGAYPRYGVLTSVFAVQCDFYLVKIIQVTHLPFFFFITHTQRIVVMTEMTAMVIPPAAATEDTQIGTPLPSSSDELVTAVYEYRRETIVIQE